CADQERFMSQSAEDGAKGSINRGAAVPRRSIPAVAFKYQLRRDQKPVSVADWRLLARKALPEISWSYVDDGSEACRTRDENQAAFDDYHFRSLYLTGITSPKLARRFAGADLALPVALAPTGMTGLSHWSGDVACARAAEAAGTRYTLSTASSYSIEE